MSACVGVTDTIITCTNQTNPERHSPLKVRPCFFLGCNLGDGVKIIDFHLQLRNSQDQVCMTHPPLRNLPEDERETPRVLACRLVTLLFPRWFPPYENRVRFVPAAPSMRPSAAACP